VTPPPKPPEPQNRVYRESSAKAVLLVGIVILAVIIGVVSALDARQPHRRNPSNDVIVACLQKSGMPSYGVGPAGPPVIGKPLTAEMFTVICVEEK
jgi:hypothetical protein